MTEINIRFDQEENVYYVCFNDAWGNCVYQSDPIDSEDEAEAVRQEMYDSAE